MDLRMEKSSRKLVKTLRATFTNPANAPEAFRQLREMAKLFTCMDVNPTKQALLSPWLRHSELVPVLVIALRLNNATMAGGGAPDRQQHSIDSTNPHLVVGIIKIFNCLSTVALSVDRSARAVLLQQVRITQAMRPEHLGASTAVI